MKNLIIALLFGAFILSACKKNQDNLSITGKWYLTRITHKSVEGSVLLDSTFSHRDYYIQFNGNGSGSKTNWIIPNQASGNFNYSLANDQHITGSLADGLVSLKVSKLSREELILISRQQVNGGVVETETYLNK